MVLYWSVFIFLSQNIPNLLSLLNYLSNYFFFNGMTQWFDHISYLRLNDYTQSSLLNFLFRIFHLPSSFLMNFSIFHFLRICHFLNHQYMNYHFWIFSNRIHSTDQRYNIHAQARSFRNCPNIYEKFQYWHQFCLYCSRILI